MSRFIPKEKLGKKARKALDSRQRNTWSFSPATKAFQSKKQYDRHKQPRAFREDGTVGLFLSGRSLL